MNGASGHTLNRLNGGGSDVFSGLAGTNLLRPSNIRRYRFPTRASVPLDPTGRPAHLRCYGAHPEWISPSRVFQSMAGDEVEWQGCLWRVELLHEDRTVTLVEPPSTGGASGGAARRLPSVTWAWVGVDWTVQSLKEWSLGGH